MITFRSALELGYDVLAPAFTASFEGYAVSMKFDPAALEARARAETWDLGSSFLAYRGAELAGSLFVSRRGRRSRVAAMGVTLPHRRTGVGRAMIERCVADSRARGDRRLVLEVLEKNEPARALYESVGFTMVRRLVGFEREPSPGGDAKALVEIELADFVDRVHAEGERNLPWQLETATLANLSLHARAWALGDAAAIVIDPGEGRVFLRAIVVPRPLRRRGYGSALVRELLARHPDRPWSSSYAIPEGLADDFFLAQGFARAPHAQLEMVYAR